MTTSADTQIKQRLERVETNKSAYWMIVLSFLVLIPLMPWANSTLGSHLIPIRSPCASRGRSRSARCSRRIFSRQRRSP